MQSEADVENMNDEELLALGIKETDLEVLRALRTNEGTVAFQGLRRQTNLHQEKLSRALQRLEEEGFVRHGPKGYSLTPRGACIAQQLFLVPPKVYTIILQSMLPGNVTPSELSKYVEGRWFGDLRWLGSKDEGEEQVLRWVLEGSGAEVVLRLRWGQLTVETDAADEANVSQVFVAAHQIVFALLQPYKEAYGQGMEVKLLGRWDRTAAG